MASLKARLLKASARLLGTAARDVPVPYEVPCDCGHRVTGIRRKTGIQVECSACNATIYVLPVNVYPSTRRVRSEVIDGSLAKRVGVVMKEIVIGEANPEGRRVLTADRPAELVEELRNEPDTITERDRDSAGKSRRREESQRGSARTPRRETREQDESDLPEPEPVVLIPRVPLVTRLRRVFSPVRLLAAAGVAVLIGTGWWMIQQRRFNDARRIWRQEMDVADGALVDEDLTVLQSALTKAVDAARVLGRADTETRRAISLLEQTEAVAGMSPLDLIGQLSGMLSADGKLNPSRAKQMAAGLSGQRFVFDCSLKTVSESEQLLAADLPLFVDTVPVRITVRSSRLIRLIRATQNAPVLFSAEIEQCEPPSDSSGEWKITLAGSSCALITTELHVSKLGYQPDANPGLLQLLERQTEFVEADRSEEPEHPRDDRATKERES